MGTMVMLKQVTTEQELRAIQQLQQDNLKKNISAEEAEKEGFVTAEYSYPFLQTMHAAMPSIIAKDGDKLVGYALVATKEVRYEHQLLSELFDAIDSVHYKGSVLKDAPYVVVGQLCVAKGYRGIGLVQQLYSYYKKCMQPYFSYAITDVASDNPRSLKAHQKAGFQVVETLFYGGISWDIVLYDFTDSTENTL